LADIVAQMSEIIAKKLHSDQDKALFQTLWPLFSEKFFTEELKIMFAGEILSPHHRIRGYTEFDFVCDEIFSRFQELLEYYEYVKVDLAALFAREESRLKHFQNPQTFLPSTVSQELLENRFSFEDADYCPENYQKLTLPITSAMVIASVIFTQTSLGKSAETLGFSFSLPFVMVSVVALLMSISDQADFVAFQGKSIRSNTKKFTACCKKCICCKKK
jgi:hypothetical protein